MGLNIFFFGIHIYAVNTVMFVKRFRDEMGGQEKDLSKALANWIYTIIHVKDI